MKSAIFQKTITGGYFMVQSRNRTHETVVPASGEIYPFKDSFSQKAPDKGIGNFIRPCVTFPERILQFWVGLFHTRHPPAISYHKITSQKMPNSDLIPKKWKTLEFRLPMDISYLTKVLKSDLLRVAILRVQNQATPEWQRKILQIQGNVSKQGLQSSNSTKINQLFQQISAEFFHLSFYVFWNMGNHN